MRDRRNELIRSTCVWNFIGGGRLFIELILFGLKCTNDDPQRRPLWSQVTPCSRDIHSYDHPDHPDHPDNPDNPDNPPFVTNDPSGVN